MAVVEHGTGFKVAAGRHTKGFEGRGRAVDPNGHVAQMHRFAGLDGQGQARVLAALHITADLRLIEAQGLGRFARLLLGATAEAQQRFFIAIAYPADVAFDVGFQRVV